MDALAELIALRRRLPYEAVFACRTAAWVHALEAQLIHPVEVIVPADASIRSRQGLTVRRSNLSPHEVTTVHGLPATSLHRTLRDLSLFYAPVEALVAIDAAVYKKLTDKGRLLADPAAARGRRGSARLRRLVELAEPAESAMETRLRWILHCARLAKPQVQANLYDNNGRFLGRADLYYPSARLVIEYDGGNHRDRLVADDRRQNLLAHAGFRILRFTAVYIYQRAEVVVSLVRIALGPRRRVA